MSAEGNVLRIEIKPAPSAEEADVIVAALAALSDETMPSEISAEIAAAPRSQWLIAGRRAAHHSSPHARRRWSRDLAWLERTAK